MMTRRVAPGLPGVAVAYLLASTDEQHLSVPAQRACIRAWAAAEHVAVVGWYEDRGELSVSRGPSVSMEYVIDARSGLVLDAHSNMIN